MKYLFYPIAIPVLVLTFTGFLSALGLIYSEFSDYLWFFAGAAIYFAANHLKWFNQNTKWMRTFTHELTHTIVGIFFLRKIHSFNASNNEGAVVHSGGNFGSLFITLAPYCLPIYTFGFALVRLLGAEETLFVFDIFMGFTLAFHLNCYAIETRPIQTDLKKSGYVRSALFIPSALFLNITLIVCTIHSNLIQAIKDVFVSYWEYITDWVKMIG